MGKTAQRVCGEKGGAGALERILCEEFSEVHVGFCLGDNCPFPDKLCYLKGICSWNPDEQGEGIKNISQDPF